MERKREHRVQGRTAASIIMILLSMAVLAERASGFPGPVRRLVLYFLRRGEKTAYSIVYWELMERGAPLFWAAPDYVRSHSDPDAAIQLGRWLRILALALRDLPRKLRFCRPDAKSASAENPALSSGWLSALITQPAWAAFPAPDTS